MGILSTHARGWTMNVTIAYISARKQNHFQWFADSLANSLSAEERAEIQVVVVDKYLWALTPEAGNTYWRRGDLISLTDPTWQVESRREYVRDAVAGRFGCLHIPPPPCVWQGPFRLTTKDWFCAGVYRDAAVMAAVNPYLICVDDLSVLLPSWWPNARHAAESGYVVCGAYKKVKDLVVESGHVKSYTPFEAGVDTRLSRGSETGIVPWSGAGLYGCSFGAPTELFLKINGNEPFCHGHGGEDFDQGIRMERAGGKFMYNVNMMSFETEEGHHVEPSLPRERKLCSADRLPADYEAYPHANHEERFYSDHVLLNRVRHETNRFTTIGGGNLRQAREEFLASGRAMIPTGPTTDWRDGAELRTL